MLLKNNHRFLVLEFISVVSITCYICCWKLFLSWSGIDVFNVYILVHQHNPDSWQFISVINCGWIHVKDDFTDRHTVHPPLEWPHNAELNGLIQQWYSFYLFLSLFLLSGMLILEELVFLSVFPTGVTYFSYRNVSQSSPFQFKHSVFALMLFLVWWKNSQNILKRFSASSGQNRQRPGSRLEGVPPGVSLQLSLNHCSWSSSPGQKRCAPALHSYSQFHSLWSSSLGSGTVWYKIAGRPSGLCKQAHSTCNGEEREMQLLRHCSALPPGLLWFNSAAGSAHVALDWRVTIISWIWTVSC